MRNAPLALPLRVPTLSKRSIEVPNQWASFLLIRTHYLFLFPKSDKWLTLMNELMRWYTYVYQSRFWQSSHEILHLMGLMICPLQSRVSWSFYFSLVHMEVLFTMVFGNPCMFVKTMSKGHVILTTFTYHYMWLVFTVPTITILKWNSHD